MHTTKSINQTRHIHVQIRKNPTHGRALTLVNPLEMIYTREIYKFGYTERHKKLSLDLMVKERYIKIIRYK